MQEIQISLNPHMNKIEATEGTVVVGTLTLRFDDDTMVIVGTEVNPDHEGRGIGGKLVRFAFEMARESGDTKVNPVCPFAAKWAERHREYHDLLTETR